MGASYATERPRSRTYVYNTGASPPTMYTYSRSPTPTVYSSRPVSPAFSYNRSLSPVRYSYPPAPVSVTYAPPPSVVISQPPSPTPVNYGPPPMPMPMQYEEPRYAGSTVVQPPGRHPSQYTYTPDWEYLPGYGNGRPAVDDTRCNGSDCEVCYDNEHGEKLDRVFFSSDSNRSHRRRRRRDNSM